PLSTGPTAASAQDDLNNFIPALRAPAPIAVNFDLHRYDSAGTPTSTTINVGLNGATIQERLAEVRDAINGVTPPAGESFPWRAELWGTRLAIVATDGPVLRGADDNRTSGFTAPVTGWATNSTNNVRHYSFGATGGGSFQTGTAGNDGSAPSTDAAYTAAFDIVRQQVDLFNLLLFPRSADNATLIDSLWSIGSTFAEENRALLLMEPPVGWSGVTTPSNEISNLRIGVSRQFAALYYPRVVVREGALNIPVSPVGAVAGVMARTDSARGFWKAPAGTEASVRGIVGVQQQLSDRENGALNPLGINVIRALPDGVVVWGARTVDGYDSAGSEYKYVPIRRVANYIGESLYRGLRWVVFEPNDEPLWAQIRLNVGGFMHDLFRKGAFQGTKPTDAYFVKCDAETTTETDRNLGIVNIWVGFAPLKPAEFVIVSLQQMAGQSGSGQ
ncbi:MAG: phage tail sheath subtilisin-like domain-containing protein, partial [Myxococcota bacterium]